MYLKGKFCKANSIRSCYSSIISVKVDSSRHLKAFIIANNGEQVSQEREM